MESVESDDSLGQIVVPSGAKRSREIPSRYLKAFATGSLDSVSVRAIQPNEFDEIEIAPVQPRVLVAGRHYCANPNESILPFTVVA